LKGLWRISMEWGSVELRRTLHVHVRRAEGMI
jgi:hypothetical protein